MNSRATCSLCRAQTSSAIRPLGADQFQQRYVVFDQQDHLVPAVARAGVRLHHRVVRGARGQPRQVDVEGRALARAALDVDPAVVLLHVAQHRGLNRAGQHRAAGSVRRELVE